MGCISIRAAPNKLLLVIAFPFSSASCISPLGLESGEITDAALTHSLPDSHLSKPQFIRLNEDVNDYPFGWLSRSGEVPPDYLQIDFGSLRRVTRMSTMGGTLSFYFVKSYKLEYSLDGMTWVNYREKGQVKVIYIQIAFEAFT